MRPLHVRVRAAGVHFSRLEPTGFDLRRGQYGARAGAWNTAPCCEPRRPTAVSATACSWRHRRHLLEVRCTQQVSQTRTAFLFLPNGPLQPSGSESNRWRSFVASVFAVSLSTNATPALPLTPPSAPPSARPPPFPHLFELRSTPERHTDDGFALVSDRSRPKRRARNPRTPSRARCPPTLRAQELIVFANRRQPGRTKPEVALRFDHHAGLPRRNVSSPEDRF